MPVLPSGGIEIQVEALVGQVRYATHAVKRNPPLPGAQADRRCFHLHGGCAKTSQLLFLLRGLDDAVNRDQPADGARSPAIRDAGLHGKRPVRALHPGGDKNLPFRKCRIQGAAETGADQGVGLLFVPSHFACLAGQRRTLAIGDKHPPPPAQLRRPREPDRPAEAGLSPAASADSHELSGFRSH